MANTQFLGRTAYTLATGAGTLLAMPAPSLAEQTVTIIVEQAAAGCLLCTDEAGDDVVLVLPTIAEGSLPFALGGVRVNAGPIYLVAAAGTPEVIISIVAEG